METLGQRTGTTCVIIGDSLTAYNGGTSIATPLQPLAANILDSKGMHNWANAYLCQDLNILGNAGIGGQKAAQIAGRFATDVLAYKPAIVTILAGTNGVGTDPTITSLQAMYDAASAAGIVVVACTIPPGSSTGSTIEAYRMKVNHWIRGWAASHRGVILADLAAAWQDPSLSGYKPFTTYVHDGVHPTSLGAAIAGRVLADALRPFVPRNRRQASAAVAPWNMLPNPHFIGSVGTVDANTKSVGAWNINGISSGVTVTTGARTDGVAGRYAEVVVPTGGSSLVSCNISVNGTTLAIGDTIDFGIQVQVAGIEAGAVMRAVQAYIQQYNGSAFGDKSHALYADGTAAPASPGWYGAGAAHPDGLYSLRTPRVVVGSGRTIVQVVLSLQGGGGLPVQGAAVPNHTKIAAA